MSPTLTIADETFYSNVELDLISNEPPGLFPVDQNSYWGQMRKVFADYLQLNIADVLAQWYENLDPRVVNLDDMPEWEYMFDIPIDNTKSLAKRRAFVLSRAEKGPFTRSRRRRIIETFIVATFGIVPRFSPAGIPLTSAGIELHAEAADVSTLYRVDEFIPGFHYDVVILTDVDVDMIGLTRELRRITSGGIDFDVVFAPNLTGMWPDIDFYPIEDMWPDQNNP